MTAIWSALVVLLLLAPFGGVGITQTPGDAEIVASPRGPAASLAKPRVEHELPPVLAVAPPVVIEAPFVVSANRASATPVAILASDRHPSAGPRDPPA
jgi:hypothetical protein